MKFTTYDLSGDVSINYCNDQIHIAARDINKAEAKCLVKVIQKAKLDIYRKKIDSKHEILLEGKGVKKAMELFLREQIRQLKKSEFFLLITKDDKAQLVSFADQFPDKSANGSLVSSIDDLKEALKIPTAKRGCGEDPEKIGRFLTTMKEFEKYPLEESNAT